MKRFLLQAAQDEDHLTPAREVFGLGDLDRAIISTAFMTASGLSLLNAVLQPIAARTRIFVGIRNGVTTIQAIQKALAIGCETYMVDTGSRTRIFHPKLYYARSATLGKLLLGSANLTMGGLRTNIEASLMQDFDAADPDNAALMDGIEAKLNAMILDFPHHVIRAIDEAQLIPLLQSGRLVDERKVRPTEPAGTSSDRTLDTLPMMALRTRAVSVPRAAAVPAPAAVAAPPAMVPVPASGDVVLVWTSKPLKRAHINLPDHAGTNPKGALSLTAGLNEDVNPREYFRQEVFNALDWEPDDKLPYKERTHANFRVIVKGINYGERSLRISHDTRTNTPAYAQNNYMTSLHWGDTAQFVAHEDILGRTLCLFRSVDDPTHFTLEID